MIQGDFQAPNWLDLQRLHHNRQEDVRKLEPLGFVQGHQTDHVFIPSPFAVRRQRRMIQEFSRVVEAAGDVD